MASTVTCRTITYLSIACVLQVAGKIDALKSAYPNIFRSECTGAGLHCLWLGCKAERFRKPAIASRCGEHHIAPARSWLSSMVDYWPLSP